MEVVSKSVVTSWLENLRYGSSVIRNGGVNRFYGCTLWLSVA